MTRALEIWRAANFYERLSAATGASLIALATVVAFKVLT